MESEAEGARLLGECTNKFPVVKNNNNNNDVIWSRTATTLAVRHRLCFLRTLGCSAELCTLTISTLLLCCTTLS